MMNISQEVVKGKVYPFFEVDYKLVNDQIISVTYSLKKEYCNNTQQYKYDRLHHLQFIQFQNAINILRQSLPNPQPYSFSTPDSNMSITQTFNDGYNLMKRESISLFQQEQVITGLINQVKDFFSYGLHICNFDFDLLALNAKTGKYEFCILPMLIRVDNETERMINLSDELHHLVRGQLLYKNTNRKLEILALLKNFVCFINQDQYKKIQDENKNQDKVELLLRENIFLDSIEQRQDKLQFKLIISYKTDDCKNRNGFDKLCIGCNCEKIRQIIYYSHSKENKYIGQVLEDCRILKQFLEEEKFKMNILRKRNILNQQTHDLQIDIDEILQKFYIEQDKLDDNFSKVKSKLQAQLKMIQDNYDGNQYIQTQKQQDIIIKSLEQYITRVKDLSQIN